MLGLRRGTVFLSKVMVISEGGLDYKAVRISVRRLLLTRASVVSRASPHCVSSRASEEHVVMVPHCEKSGTGKRKGRV
jgi:hypothetical protein